MAHCWSVLDLTKKKIKPKFFFFFCTGAYGPEKVTKMVDLRPELRKELEKEDEDADNVEGKLTQWRKDGSKSAKVKYVYKSVDDVLEDQDRGKVYKREFK